MAGGRPQFKPTPEQRYTVEQAARIGMKEDHIRLLIKSKTGKPIARNTLRRCFKEELKLGSNDAHFAVLAAAYTVATDPNHDRFATLNIWYQKTQIGINDKTIIEPRDPDGNPLPVAPLVILRTGNPDADPE